MPAYFIVQNTIKDEAQYQKYVQVVVPFIASRPRNIPGSDYRGAIEGMANTPPPPGFRPSSGPWADYLARRDRWSHGRIA